MNPVIDPVQCQCEAIIVHLSMIGITWRGQSIEKVGWKARKIQYILTNFWQPKRKSAQFFLICLIHYWTYLDIKKWKIFKVGYFLFEDGENEVINWKILLPLCSNVVSLQPLPTAQIVPCRFTQATLSAPLTALTRRLKLLLQDGMETFSHFISNLALHCCNGRCKKHRSHFQMILLLNLEIL